MKTTNTIAARFASFHRSLTGQPAGSQGPGRPRRGVAVLLVLAMLAMTLALSYASLRGQATVAQLAENLGRGEAARLAAESGVYSALRKMSDGTWAGIDAPFTAYLSDNSWYDVSFATGDAQLTSADPKYGEFAYRVTITSVGYADDPGQPAVRAIHKIDAVVQLARRAMLAEPATWAALEPYTVHQWAVRPVSNQFPVRISEPVNFLGTLSMFTEYPLSTEPEKRYFEDLETMRQNGMGDHRPFEGPVTIAKSQQTTETLNYLENDLELTTIDTSASTTPPAPHPNSVSSYRLYPGGKSYPLAILQTTYGGSLQDLTLEPDPINNPLGIHRSRNSLAIHDNVHIKGTIISEGTTPEIQIHGANVTLEGVTLAALEGTTQAYQLPVAIVRDDLRLHGTSDAVIKGLAMVYDQFELKAGPKTAKFGLDGQLMAADFAVRGRNEFALIGTVEWESQHALFLAQLLLPLPNKIVYFPLWMQQQSNLPYAPYLKFDRDDSGVKYHWHTWTQPVFQKDPADPGLRWNLVRWTEGAP